MKLTSEEKETIIVFNECDKTADIETFNKSLIKQAQKAKEMYPEQVVIKPIDEEICTITLPKKWIKIRAPRIITDEQRAILAERARASGFGAKS